MGRWWLVVVWSMLLGCGPSVVDIGGGGTDSGGDGDDGTISASGADGCEPSGDEVCDGIDNDCDGLVDEGILPVTCGMGGCQLEVRCEGGVMPECVPAEPQAEVCNLVDDDCDGVVDNGLDFGATGDLVVLRQDEFDTGSCISCRWAWDPSLAPLADGTLLATWNLGLDGGNEQPTMFGRVVDVTGAPLGSIAQQRDDFFTRYTPIPGLKPYPAGGTPVWVTHRVPGQEDTEGLLFVGTDGSSSLVKPPVAYDVETPVVWTGERFIVGWEEDDALRLAVLDASGAIETMIDIDPLERVGDITLAAYTGRVGVLVSRVRVEENLRDEWFILLDSFGNVVVPAHEIDIEYGRSLGLVGTSSGWLRVHDSEQDGPTRRQSLAVDGTPAGDAGPFADDREIASGIFVPRPAQGETLSVWSRADSDLMAVEFLDDAGDSLRGWTGHIPSVPADGDGSYLSDPHAELVDGHVLVIWHGLAGDSQANPVYARQFGCIP